jgi:two-component system chemotaxis response regulator CheB
MDADTAPSGASAPSSELAAEPDEGRATSQRDIVVVGASAGGVEALSELVGGLPRELPAAVFVVLHVMPGGTSVLPSILGRAGSLPVAAAVDGEEIRRGQVYVASPDRHMLIDRGRVRLTSGPRENGHRPAVDPLFRSAARAYGRRVIGVILSGALDDGSAGLKMIGDEGGLALVEHPDDALYPGMPSSALEYAPGAQAVPLAELADTICAAIEEAIPEEGEPLAGQAKSPPLTEVDRADDDPRMGTLTAITCPECGGSLWEHDEEGLIRFKCHVGHAYSPESLEVSHGEALEGALWAALRSLQERAELYRRLARRIGGGPRLEEKAQVADEHARVLRSLVASFGSETGTAGETGRAGERGKAGERGRAVS